MTTFSLVLIMIMRIYIRNKLREPNTKSFKRTLIYYDTDTQSANFRGNPFDKLQNDAYTTVKRLKKMKNEVTYLLFGRVVVQCSEETNYI